MVTILKVNHWLSSEIKRSKCDNNMNDRMINSRRGELLLTIDRWVWVEFIMKCDHVCHDPFKVFDTPLREDHPNSIEYCSIFAKQKENISDHWKWFYLCS
jgi:hypothetical protein